MVFYKDESIRSYNDSLINCLFVYMWMHMEILVSLVKTSHSKLQICMYRIEFEVQNDKRRVYN